MPLKFIKPAIDSEAQLALLRSRGLLIADDRRAIHYLRFVGYYRLAVRALLSQTMSELHGPH